MDENGSDLGQILNMEVEGVKIALKMSQGALLLAGRLGLFLLNSFKNAKYIKKVGATNIKNLKARANGQALIPYLLDWETLKKFNKLAKEYGILYHVTESLRSAPNTESVHILFAESDMASVRELMNKIKEDYIKENVKKGMNGEEAEKDFNTKNSPETMQEFAENVGIMTPPETFDADMREKFGDDYATKFEQIDIKQEKGKGTNQDFLEALAKNMESSARMQDRLNEQTVEFPFEYDEKNRKSHIVEATDTHIKVLLSENGKACVWLPKDAVFPPLTQKDVEDGMRKAVLKEDDVLLVQDIESKEIPFQIPAKEFTEDIKKMEEKFSISVTKQLIKDENEQVIKTRVPGTWGENVRFLWIDKKDAEEIHSGKSILTSLDKNKEYNLYSEDDQLITTMSGKDLYDGHYDKIPEKTGKTKTAKERTIKRG